MNAPEVRYARRDGASLAFQVAGHGHPLLLVAGAASTTVAWEDPTGAELHKELAGTAQLVSFDQRGSGRSDPLTTDEPLPLEERVADALAILDELQVADVDLIAMHDGGPVALLAAASHPDRCRSLTLINSAPRLAWAPDYPQGFDRDVEESWIQALGQAWGTGFTLPLWAPSYSDLPDGPQRWARIEQAACSPGQAVRQSRQTFATDARHLLEFVTAPTLVIQRRDDPSVPPGNGRYLADRLSDCTLIELPGADHMPYSGDIRMIVAAVRTFLGHDLTPTETERRLGAVAFTDIVGSTELLSRLGDSRWRQVLDSHDDLARQMSDRYGGRIVKSTGDGLLALFTGPAQAIRFATALQSVLADHDVPIRAGIHVGEIVPRGEDIAGIAVHAAARVAALAPANSVLVSGTVTDLVSGSGLTFEKLGDYELKGIPGSHAIFVVTGDNG